MNYKEFIERFRLFAHQRPELVLNTLSNIFSMRLIGNKTHGDLAEIGISEFINQFIYDLGSIHVGKQFYRSKSQEEDIVIIDKLSNSKSFNKIESISTFSLLNISEDELEDKKRKIQALESEEIAVPVSLKAYGNGPLQISTDKDSQLFSLLEEELKRKDTSNRNIIKNLFQNTAFSEIDCINVLSFIYDERNKRCKIVVFDIDKALSETDKILYISKGKGREHPIYKFVNKKDEYIFEVRYGGKSANALQRGMWTHTKNASNYFIEITDGWISYEHNFSLVKLISLALNASEVGHKKSSETLQKDIDNLFKNGK